MMTLENDSETVSKSIKVGYKYPTKFAVTAQGSLLTVSEIGFKDGLGGDMKKVKRGKIRGFSAKSRKRALELAAKVRTKKRLVFITLTYIDAPTPKRAKQDLHNFLQHVYRHAPKAGVMWRMEYQKRGAVHFHFLCFNMPFWRKENLSKTWARITGDPREPRTRIEAVRSRKHAMAYVSKYIAKADSSSGLVYSPYPNEAEFWQGRIWGVRGGENIPYCPKLTFIFGGLPIFLEIEKHEIKKAYRLLRLRACQLYPLIAHYENTGFTVFCDRPFDLIRDLTQIINVQIISSKEKHNV